MRKLTSYLLAGSVAAATVGAVTVARVNTAHAQAAQATKAGKGERKEKHPAIHAAINSLERAKKELEAAAHDFGGHRVDAIKAIDEALKQLRLADAYDAK